MKLTVKQMHGLLKHPDSPYIRAVRSLSWVPFDNCHAPWCCFYSLDVWLLNALGCISKLYKIQMLA
jgi:hypothetical protein